VNYSPFLNKSSKYNISNDYYILEDKKKSSSFFLFSSIISIIALVVTAVFVLNSSINLNSFMEKASFLATDIIEDNNTNTSIELPELSFSSEISPEQEAYTKTSAPADSIYSSSSKKIIAETNETASKQDTKENVAAAIVLEQQIALEPQTALQQKLIQEEPIASKQLSTPAAPVVSTIPLVKNITKTVVVKKGDSLSAIFQRLSLSSSTLYKVMHSGKEAKNLRRIKPGQKIIIMLDNNSNFKALYYDIDNIDSLIIEKEKDSGQFISQIKRKEIDTKKEFATGIITGSLFSAGKEAGLSYSMTMQLAKIFAWDIDFAQDIRKGDSFSILYEEKYINDKKVANGNILSAEFINKGKVHTAIRYTDTDNHTAYYSADGHNMHKAFLRSPVHFSRISSRFSSGRKHPVLNNIRAHKGVDYAAARGTPIRAAGNGIVDFIGRKGGYGRVIILKHLSDYTTLYAHMNSYNKKIKRGSRVKQGQVIGYVGSSGLATGPHLHYEFRKNGVHRDPLKIKFPKSLPIAKKYRRDFHATAETLISQMKLRKQHNTIALLENKKTAIQ